MFHVTDKSGMIAKGAHFPEVVVHIIIFRKQKVSEKTVYGKYRRGSGEVLLYCTDGISDGLFEIPQFQKDEDVGIIHLPEAGQGISVYFLDGYNTGVVPVDFSEGIFKGLGQYLFFRYVQDILINLFGGLTVQLSDYVIGLVW